MEPEEIVKQARRILNQSAEARREDVAGILSESTEFIRQYAGEKSAFYKSLSEIDIIEYTKTYHSSLRALERVRRIVTSVVKSFIRYVESGLLEGVSIERKAQLDVVSDFLEQAHTLLETRGVHPAAPAMIIGASLEEFLRNWVESADLSIGNKKRGINNYATTLREANLITKQDVKDITSWAGIRNDADHGHWDKVSDKKRIHLMLEGVNLFLQQHTLPQK